MIEEQRYRDMKLMLRLLVIQVSGERDAWHADQAGNLH